MSRTTLSAENSACDHPVLSCAESSHANDVGYQRLTPQQRATAAGKKKPERDESEDVFPAPLVLPGDELSYNPDYPPQCLRSWTRLKERNEVTKRRNVLYVVGPPSIAANVAFVRDWSLPKGTGNVKDSSVLQPNVEDVADYLGAFHHGMPVSVMSPDALRFTQWDASVGALAVSVVIIYAIVGS